MPIGDVVLTDDPHEVIEFLGGAGRHQCASKILRDGLRLVDQCEAEDAANLDALRDAANGGWRDLEAGRYRDVGEDAMADHARPGLMAVYPLTDAAEADIVAVTQRHSCLQRASVVSA